MVVVLIHHADALGPAMSRKRLAQEAFGRWQVSICAEEELDRVANAIDGAVEIHPPAPDLDVSLCQFTLQSGTRAFSAK